MANTGSDGKKGPRLEFVVRELPGTIVRQTFVPPPTREQREEDPKLRGQTDNKHQQVIEPAGYMVYMPTGQCYRVSHEELLRRKLDREPNMIGFEQANDQDTAMGRFKLARTEAGRQAALMEMEKEIIDLCRGRTGGDMTAMIEGYDPRGRLPVKEAA